MPPSFGAAWDSLDIEFGSFLKDSWMFLGDSFLDVSNQNMIVYEFNTSRINFFQNKHVKLDETRLGTLGHFMAYFSIVMDIL